MNVKFLLIGAFLVFLASGCVSNAPPEATNEGQGTPIEGTPEPAPVPPEAIPAPTPLPLPEPTPPQPQQGMLKEFTISAKQWEFTPSTIEVNKGDRVVLHITSTDVPHGFAIQGYDINVNLPPGQPVDANFVADKAGTFRFFCSVFCGQGHSGMAGQLIVNE